MKHDQRQALRSMPLYYSYTIQLHIEHTHNSGSIQQRLPLILYYDFDSIAADQSKDNHRESIIIQVSNSDLHSLTTDFV